MRELTCQQAAAETGFLQAVEMLISLLLLQSNSTVNPRYIVSAQKFH